MPTAHPVHPGSNRILKQCACRDSISSLANFIFKTILHLQNVGAKTLELRASATCVLDATDVEF